MIETKTYADGTTATGTAPLPDVSPTAPPPHMQRVMDERADLDRKIEALIVFLGGPIFVKLDTDEQQRLHNQLLVMRQYTAILTERIYASQRPAKTSGTVELDSIGNDKSNWDGASPAITTASVKAAIARAAAAAGLVYTDVHVEIDISTLEVTIIFVIGDIKRGITTGGKITKNRTIDNLAQVAVARVMEWANDPMAIR